MYSWFTLLPELRSKINSRLSKLASLIHRFQSFRILHSSALIYYFSTLTCTFQYLSVLKGLRFFFNSVIITRYLFFFFFFPFCVLPYPRCQSELGNFILRSDHINIEAVRGRKPKGTSANWKVARIYLWQSGSESSLDLMEVWCFLSSSSSVTY